MLDVHVARAANDQGLAVAGGHRSNPGGFLASSRPPEIPQRPNVVHLDVLM